MTNYKIARSDVPHDREIMQEIAAAEQIKNPYFRLRAKATVALLETGKRRSEIASLRIDPEDPDIWTDETYLYVRFTVVKKKRKGLNQYIKFLEKNYPAKLERSFLEISAAHKVWRNEAKNQTIMHLKRVKKYKVDSAFAQMILEYVTYLREVVKTKFVYPSGHNVFDSYVIDPDAQLKPQEIWRIIKALNPRDSPHLHRERRAVKVIRRDEKRFGSARLETIFRIKHVLDLEREETAYNYIRRHEAQRVDETDEVLA